ncbi:hypothetical protein [Streptomyces sp. NPDC048349]|uniref:hypothetical protein n=1 Tax=Streptomyces sp. NPDC048349 TaxID=3155486 RepID=UPI0034323EFC
MQIIAVVAAAVTAAAASMVYMRYAAAGSQERRIPGIFARLAYVPLRVELVCYPAWFASALLLGFTLPSWAAVTVYGVAALLPWELLRRRHNLRVGNDNPI